MRKEIPTNYRQASNMVFAYSGLGFLLALVFSMEQAPIEQILMSLGFTLLWAGLAMLVRRGIRWTRYVILLFAGAGTLIGIPQAVRHFGEHPGYSNSILILQTITLLFAAFFVFSPPKAQK